MKTIKSYILERLILNKQRKLSDKELKELISMISDVLNLEGYANGVDSEDNINDIIKGVKEGILVAGIISPYFLTCQSYYNEISDYGADVEEITPITDESYRELCQKINYRNGDKVFESNEMYGLNIYANEYGINFAYYQDSIFVIDANNELMKDIDIDDEDAEDDEDDDEYNEY